MRDRYRKLPTGKSKRKKKPITYPVGLVFSYLYTLTNKVKKCRWYTIHQVFCWGKFNSCSLIEIEDIEVIWITTILFLNCFYSTSLSLSPTFWSCSYALEISIGHYSVSRIKTFSFWHSKAPLQAKEGVKPKSLSDWMI